MRYVRSILLILVLGLTTPGALPANEPPAGLSPEAAVVWKGMRERERKLAILELRFETHLRDSERGPLPIYAMEWAIDGGTESIRGNWYPLHIHPGRQLLPPPDDDFAYPVEMTATDGTTQWRRWDGRALVAEEDESYVVEAKLELGGRLIDAGRLLGMRLRPHRLMWPSQFLATARDVTVNEREDGLLSLEVVAGPEGADDLLDARLVVDPKKGYAIVEARRFHRAPLEPFEGVFDSFAVLEWQEVGDVWLPIRGRLGSAEVEIDRDSVRIGRQSSE